MTARQQLPPTTPAGFVIGIPALSRGSADRSEDLREPTRIRQEWMRARVLTLAGNGTVRLDPGTGGLHTTDALAVADQPPSGAVLLGAVGGVDHWAVRGEVLDGAGLRQLGALLPDTDAGLLTTATALLTWHAAAGFCPRCGLPSTPTTAGWSRICPRGHEEFPRTDPAVIVLVHDGADSIVLARQPIWPAGRVSVLAGFVEAGESLEGTVVREVFEEIGVQVTDVNYLGSQPWPFPRSLMVGFGARAEPGAPLKPRPGEIEEATWFDRTAVRAMIAAESAAGTDVDRWASPPATFEPSASEPSAAMSSPVPGASDGSVVEVILPGPVSIARRMIQAWAERG